MGWACLVTPQAQAQGRLEAQYSVSVARIPVGKGALVLDIADDQYSSAASGHITGVLRALTTGEGSAAARGIVTGGRLIPTSYAIKVVSDDKTDEIRMVLSGGNVKELLVDPPLPPSDDRIPVTELHRRAVMDPLSAGLVPMLGSGDIVVPEACHRTLPVFDGRQRYDLALAFKRMDNVKSDKGYEGSVVVCSIMYQPLAGHRTGRAAIKFLTETRDMEISLAPVAGTRVLVPYRIAIPTLIGNAVIEATQFVSTPQPARASSAPATSKTQ